MRIVVTGGAGFIGTNLLKRLVKNENNIIGVFDDYSANGKKETYRRWRAEGIWNPRLYRNLKYHDVDVTFDNQFTNPPDICYHLAAVVSIPESIEKPGYTIKNNHQGLLNILEWSRRTTKFPIVFAGSASRYGNVYDNPYAFSKYQGEELCKLYSELYDIPITTCRFFNVYGPHAPTQGQYVGVIGIFSRLFKEGKPLTITGDGTQTRDFIHVEDIVDGLVRCGNSYYARDDLYTTFDFGTGTSYSLNEIAKGFGEDYPIEYIEERKGEIKHSICDPTEAKELLDWETKNDVLDYINDTYL